jgi:hypothetical protein
VGSSCNGLDIDIKGQFQAQLILKNALPGWKSGTYEIEQPLPKSIYKDCLPFPNVKRDLPGNDTAVDVFAHNHLAARQTIGSNLPDPDSSGTCALSVKGVYCAGDDGSDDPAPSCNWDRDFPVDSDLEIRDKRDLSSVDMLMARFVDEFNASTDGTLHMLSKRAAETRNYCAPSSSSRRSGQFAVDDYVGVSATNRGNVRYQDYPPSGSIKTNHPGNAAFDQESNTNCDNYNLRRQTAGAVTDTSRYGCE